MFGFLFEFSGFLQHMAVIVRHFNLKTLLLLLLQM